MTKHGKRYKEAYQQIERARAYTPEEAVDLVKQSASTKFDETVELHLRMGLDPRNASQQVRGVALLPHGLGKPVRVLVFAQGEAARNAENAGADYVGADELAKKIEEGWLEFGRILGRRGLMPNPKAGTVVAAEDLPRVIEDARKGRVEFKLDRTAIIHLPLGKASFDSDKLIGNLSAIIDAIVKAKPSGAKGQYVKSAFITTTMGPSIKLDLRPTLALAAS
jgi:large subunit ribosomal protein L1